MPDDSLENMTHEQLLAAARQMQESHRLLNVLVSNPETREATQRLVKKAEPTRVIPELDTKDQIEAALKKDREERAAEMASLREKEIKREITEQRTAIKAKYDLTDADVVEVEKIMTEQGIMNWESAAKVYVAGKQLAAPTPSSIKPPIFEMPEKEVWAKGMHNPQALNRIALEEAYKAANEVGFFNKKDGLGPAIAR